MSAEWRHGKAVLCTATQLRLADVRVSSTGYSVRRLLTGKEAAARLSITEDQLTALVQAGEIAYINVGLGSKRPRRRFTRADLDDFEARRRRREACLSGSPKTRRSIGTTSGSAVIGFMALRNAQRAKKPKKLKP
ncbi:excisionase family DNA binding protein [Bradyrhizobium diazoefficiens]